MLALKTLKPGAVPNALEMAKRYRMINEPDEAESICLDILQVEPNHQEALITLLLALTDKFDDDGLQAYFERAMEVLQQLDTAYCKAYYTGIIYERRAKYHFRRGGMGSGAVAHEWFVKALAAFDRALESCDPNNQDAVLRWNSCARFLNSHPDLKPDDAAQADMLLDAYDMPH